MEKDDKKIYTLYAGVNGAGKSTIYETIKDYSKDRINADEILVSNGGDWKNTQDQIRAGKEAIRKIDSFINQGISFNQETTLAGQTILRTIQKAKEHGFFVELYYIGLKSPELAIKRVQNRVAKGGHGIDEEVIKRRYEASLNMLKKVVPLCDIVVVYDNSEKLKIIAKYTDKKWILYNKKCEWFNKSIPGITKSISKEESKKFLLQNMTHYKTEIKLMKKGAVDQKKKSITKKLER